MEDEPGDTYSHRFEPPDVAWLPEDNSLAWVGGSDTVPAKEVDGPNWAYGKHGNQLTVLQARVYFTNDGGKTWTKQPLTDGYKVEDIQFIDATHGVARTESDVFYTNDQGKHWTPSKIKIPGVKDYQSKIDGFIKAELAVLGDAVWVGFCDGHLFKSADRGRSFDLVLRSTEPHPCFLRLFFISATAGWALDLDDGGLVFSTSDAGRSWKRMNWPPATDLFVLDARHGWVTTPSGVFNFDPSAK
jgi:photosystem II stability/assembly factor-like uncharacterized protein